MILKYQEAGSWNYISDIRHVKTTHLDGKTLVETYDKTIPVSNEIITHSDIAMTNGDIMSNKIFLLATKDQNEYGDQVHAHCSLDPFMVEDNYPIVRIIASLNKWREFDTEVLVTNQAAYLMSDEGKTIERLA